MDAARRPPGRALGGRRRRARRRRAPGLALTRFLAGMLFGVPPTDAAVFASVATLLGGVAIVSGCIPALHASRIEPAASLRGESGASLRGE